MTKVDDTPDNFNICMQGNCSSCPSYHKGMGEGLFCARGPSKMPIERRGCNCPECPVWKDNGLSSMYYCRKTESA